MSRMVRGVDPVFWTEWIKLSSNASILPACHCLVSPPTVMLAPLSGTCSQTAQSSGGERMWARPCVGRRTCNGRCRVVRTLVRPVWGTRTLPGSNR